jgi:hypothetical protein
MARAEQQGLAYLFRLRMMKNVQRSMERAMRQSDWANAGQGGQLMTPIIFTPPRKYQQRPGSWECMAANRSTSGSRRNSGMVRMSS